MRNLLLLISFLALTGTDIHAQGFVFPGDANRDGLVDHFDILPIGFAYGNLGPTRESAGSQEAQLIQAHWPGVFPSGTNYIHADADGNGLINVLDFITVAQNQGLMHENESASFEMVLPPNQNSPVLKIGDGEELIPAMISGQTLSIPISIEQSQGENWLNGLAFTLNYNQDIVSSATFSFADEWLGESGLSFRFGRGEEGQFRVAITRFGANPVTGDGRVGTLELVIIEDLVGFLPTTPGAGATVAEIEDLAAVSGTFQAIAMNDEELVTQPVNAILPTRDERKEVTDILTVVSPNPTEATLTVTSQEPFQHIELIDLTGRVQDLYKGPRVTTWFGQVDNQPAGLYYLRTRGTKSLSITPLIIN